MPSLWTDSEIDLLKKHLNTPPIDVANLFPDRSYDSVQKKLKSLKGGENVLVFSELPEPELPLASVTKTVYQPLMVSTDTIERTVGEWLLSAKSLKGKKATVSKEVKEGISLVILLSDNHFGKKTEDFNLEIARQRLLSIPEWVLDAGGPNDRVTEVVVILAGDIVEGEDIFSNQNGGLECPVIYQAKSATEAIWQLILNLKETFQCPVRVETCPGNHGRMSKTADQRSNWDNVVYLMVSNLAEQNPELDVRVNLNFEDFSVFRVRDKNVMAYHYGVKHLGTPATQVKYAGWIISNSIDLIVHGHWHQWGVETFLGRPMIANGCMCGPDDLAERMAKEEPPRQAYFYIEKGKPIRNYGFIEW